MRYKTLMERMIAARMLRGKAIDTSTIQGQRLAKRLSLPPFREDTGEWQERVVEEAERKLEEMGSSQLPDA